MAASQANSNSPELNRRYQVTVTGSMVCSTSFSWIGNTPQSTVVTRESDRPYSQRPEEICMENPST
ncbi:hypothetical protein D3C78_1595870 [compost metagenome]